MIYVNSVISYILENLCYSTIRLHLILVLIFNGRYSQRSQVMLSLTTSDVLILVLKEKILSELTFDQFVELKETSLNPCFNGWYSQRDLSYGAVYLDCLNPCFNGRYSQRAQISQLMPYYGGS